MKLVMLFCLIIFASCAHNRGPASVDGNPVAYDSKALGNIKADAIKRVANGDVCFDINLQMKNVQAHEAQASNWTLAWVDNNNQYHPVPVANRNPASAPVGGAVVTPYYYYNEYKNTFTSCAPKAQFENVKGLVLTPKDSTYKNEDLKLSWY